ncbi:hypothetical protein P8C59_004828 [Phyllachora maydis]|uniref:Mitotic checkpoint regulator, MAD2B-interacting-domain-containing protein n=1 Tax=Phyllachora maydis TaxID=1825666 RepID=A0AAD9I4H2_9PEZI|nr:hypothetical protein P8C59_004828 [Phyllachora maydis]
MGLVDYSDSESEPEPSATKPVSDAPAPATQNRKGPASKLLNRSATGKILVNLPGAAREPGPPDGPPAKRAKTGAGAGAGAGAGSSRFSRFSSFLPPPKNAGKPAAVASGSRSAAVPRIGLHLKTSSEAAFSREPVIVDGEDDHPWPPGSEPAGLRLPPPKTMPSGPSIPEGQRPEEEVKLVGKPLIFRPLSVSRKPVRRKDKQGALAKANAGLASAPESTQLAGSPGDSVKKKKVSLFAAGDDEGGTSVPVVAGGFATSVASYHPSDDPCSATAGTPGSDDIGTYTSSYEALAQQVGADDANLPSALPHPHAGQPPGGAQQSLSVIADDLKLSAQDRRDLFGRGGAPSVMAGGGGPKGAKVISFDMAREYEANEALRAAGDQQLHNPVRSIQPGKHSLRQMVSMAQENRGALEDSFASQRNNRNEAAGRYGWK